MRDVANTKNNARFRATETRIEDAALDLMRSVRPEKLTVRAVCEAAEINRSTFYAHFLDVADLVERIEARLRTELFARYGSVPMRALTAVSFVPFLSHVRENAAFYRIALPLRNDYPIAQGREQLFDTVLRPRLEAAGVVDPEAQMLCFVFFQAGFTQVLRRWVEGGCAGDIEEIAALIEGCVPPVLSREGLA